MKHAVLAAFIAAAPTAQAQEFDWGEDRSLSLKHRVTLGAAWRMQDRDSQLIGKLNLNPELCDGDDCRDFGGDPAPNQRLVDAPGGFAAHNQDNGNLNYDKGELVFGTAKLTSEATFKWGELTAFVKAQGTFDEVNTDFLDRHFNTRYQPTLTPRSKAVEDQVGKRVDLMDAYLSYPFNIAGREAAFSIGEQRIRWGEANTIQLNSIGEINPPDQNILFFPGVELADLFKPVGLALAAVNLSDTLTLEVLYQYRWEALRPAAAGSFLSSSDIGGGGDYAVIAEGQASEDPQFIGTPAGTLGFLSSTSYSVPILPESFGEPRDGGQYGFSLRGFLPEFLNGTEWGVYFLNYHSRLPYGSLFAANDSCWRGSTSFPDALVDCRGFNGSANPTGLGLEPLPLDTMRIFLDYPEDIRMYGASFNTTLGLWSLAGEYAYRPNLPVQVQVQDVVFAAAAPLFPRQALAVPGVGSIPTARQAAPDFIETIHRGNLNITANSLIRGYERLKVGQLSLTAIRILSATANPFGADQILLLVEAGATHVLDMPGLDRVQFDGGSANATHHSPGADGSGRGGVPDTRSTVPTQQIDDFADEFAWGYRVLARTDYNALAEWLPVVRPLFAAFHDVGGVSVAPMQNFVEGRLQFIGGVQFEFSQNLGAQAIYQWYTGGGALNKLADRDYLSVSIGYSF